jgi:hypothetical protein
MYPTSIYYSSQSLRFFLQANRKKFGSKIHTPALPNFLRDTKVTNFRVRAKGLRACSVQQHQPLHSWIYPCNYRELALCGVNARKESRELERNESINARSVVAPPALHSVGEG